MGQLGNLSPAASIAVGILVGLLSTSIQSIGLTLQRKSHLLEDSKQDDSLRRPPYRRRRWQVGMLMFVVANLVGSTIQITTLPLPVLSTLQASGLVFNTICASVLLGEPFTRWSLGGTSLVAAGALLIALFGALPEPTHSLDSLLVLLHRPAFIAWMVCTFLAVGLILMGIAFLPRLMPHHERRPSSRSRSLSRSFTSHTMQASHTHNRLTPRLRLMTGMSLGAVSAVLSAHCLLIAKSAVELLVQTASGSNQFNRFESWLILIALVVFALSQLYFLHRGLKLCSTSILYPFVFCVYNIVAILDGLIYFDQTDDLPPLHAGLIALGTVILLAGVLALSWRLSDERSQENAAQAHAYPYGHSPTTAELGQQSLLTPGMGMVEDTPTDSATPASTPGIESDTYHWGDESDDEGTPVAAHTERTPLLVRTRNIEPRAKAAQTSSSGLRRARFQLEEDEDALDVWDALMDVGAKELATRDSPSRSASKRPRRASTLGLLRPQRPGLGHERSPESRQASDSPFPLTPTPLRRTKTVGPASRKHWSWVPDSPLTPRSWLPRSQRNLEESFPVRAEAPDEGRQQVESADLPSHPTRTILPVPSWLAGWFGTRRNSNDRGKTRATDETRRDRPDPST